MGTPGRGRADYYAPGDYNMVCSMCGRKAKASMLVRNWQGLYRHPYCDEPRHPQDFARGIKDDMSVPFAQKPLESFVSTCSLTERSAIPGYAGPGCSIPGNIYFPNPYSLFNPADNFGLRVDSNQGVDQ